MRLKNPSRRLVLEPLENRCCPAANFTFDAARNLTIVTDNTVQDVAIISTTPGTLNITVNGGPATTKTFTNVHNLTVTTGNANSFVSLFMNGGGGLLGNFTVNNLSSNTNLGTDFLFIQGPGNILGNVSVTNEETTEIVQTQITGNLTINDSGRGGGSGIDTVLYGTAMTPLTIGGNLNFTGGGGLGSSLALSYVSVTGNVLANLGFGAGNGYSDDQNTTVNGNLAITSSGAAKTIELSGQVGGSDTIGLSPGMNTLYFNNTASVGKNFSFTAGNSTVPGSNVINAFQGTIGGNLNINFGNGANFIGDAVMNTFTPTILGTSITIVLGNGTNIVTLSNGTNAPNAHLQVILGNGANTLNLGSNNFKNGSIQFGHGTNFLNMQPPLTAFTFPLTVHNL